MARTKRQRPSPPPQETVTVKTPPNVVRSEGITGTLAMILPMFGSMGMMAVMALSSNRSPQMLLMSGAFMVAMVGVAGLNIYRNRVQHRDAVTGSRREYLTYIATLRKNARKAEDMQREFTQWFLPHPADLPLILDEGSRIAERETTDDEFLLCRIGSADQPFATELAVEEESSLAETDPVAESARARFMASYETLESLPLGVNLASVSTVQLTGRVKDVRGLARAMVVHLASFLSEDHLKIAVLSKDENMSDWDWVKWLPHVQSERIRDAVGPARMVHTSADSLVDLLPDGISDRPRFSPDEGGTELPHLVIVNDGVRIPIDHPIITPDGVLGVTVIDLPESWDALTDPSTIRLTLRNGRLTLLQVGFEPIAGEADSISIEEAEAVARRLTSPMMAGPGEDSSGEDQDATTEASAELVDLLGIGDVRDLDVTQTWRPRLNRDKLRVPIGLTPEGKTVYLDFKESAQQGMGPHGLIIGATGSGKSEVLRTLVLALAMTHSSEDLNFVLIDFKGGATFAGMSGMPHVSATITNLGDDLTLVDRMEDALRGEMARRQEMLRAGGNFKNVQDYEKARKDGRTDLEPLPALLIVADEFSELLAEKPDFIDMFVAIGRLGRSLSIHLLLSSQRLEESRLRGLDSHLSYRIGLRTFSAAESRTVLGVADAYELPPIPGVGYLKEDQTTMRRFRASYVSGPPPRRRVSAAPVIEHEEREEKKEVAIVNFTAAPVLLAQSEEPEPEEVDVLDPAEDEIVDEQGGDYTTFDIAVDRMEGQGPAAHKVWLDPLSMPASLDRLMGDLGTDKNLGYVSKSWRGAGAFTIPVGEVDRPYEQRRDTLLVDLSGAGGHASIVGGPQSGKSTLMRTIMAGIALTHTPTEVQFYVMDFGGGTFAPFRDLAHTAGIALRKDTDRVNRIVAEIASIIDDREQFFADNGIDSMETYRRMRAAGEADDGYGDIFLFIDNWATLRADFDQVESKLQNLMPRGLNFGLHVVASALRWMNFRTQVKDMFGTRLELRLGDPLDSEIDRKVAKNVPERLPGRGLEPGRHHFLGALPRVDGEESPDTVSVGVRDLVSKVNEAWKGERGPKLRELPLEITIDDVRAMVDRDDRRILLGINESRLEPFGIDFWKNDHFYFYGGQGSGKTATLRLIASEIARVYTPETAQIFAVDYRRSLLGELPEGYVGGYYTTADQAMEQLGGLANYLKVRMPGPNVTPQQLRDRSWWEGKEVFILVDDYDLVNTPSGNPVAAFQPLMAQAHDLGLHIILTRRSGGAQRALFEPVMQTMNDLAVPAMLLPGSPEDGQIIGKLKPQVANPGRAQFRSREVPREQLQIAWEPPELN
ncbi:MAG: type VII secretion protein EccCa [Flaviflexus sp.]|uniref:type VII secretion protein EccCa n=1 Tax=Flaviflexus sp. TaxID=1969482 RepID=UPI003F8F8DF6